MIRSLTENQAKVMTLIRTAIGIQAKELEQFCKEMGGTPSEWIPVHTLATRYKVRRDVITALLRKGYLLKQPSDESGTVVKPAWDTVSKVNHNPYSVVVNSEWGYIRIMQGDTEVLYWEHTEWEEDPELVFTIANAVVLATTDPNKFAERLSSLRRNAD